MMKLAFRCRSLSLGVASAFLAACGGGESSVPPVWARNAAAFAHHKTFTYIGRAQKFTVPNGVRQIKVDALGANGGSFETGDFRTGPGGYGGRVLAMLNVTPEERLFVYVGGPGFGSTGGFNGGAAGGTGEVSGENISGAGGGGESDVRTSSPLGNRVVVAGGGGGGGGIYTKRLGSNFGGKGNGPIGDSGGSSSKCGKYGVCGDGGGGGTQSAGGAGGASGGGWCKYQTSEFCGNDGTLGVGGAGGTGGQYLTSGGGGGGGGGYYGGGGGGAGSYNYPPSGFPGPGGGGGGGSSYAESGASGVKMWAGWKARQRVVVIYW